MIKLPSTNFIIKYDFNKKMVNILKYLPFFFGLVSII